MHQITILLILFVPFISYAEDLIISNMWARPSVYGKNNSAIYMDISNASNKQFTLISAKTNIAEKTELHKTVVENNIASMVHIDKFVIPANSIVHLKPGDMHIMIIKLNSQLKEGDKLDLELFFEDKESMNISVPVVAKNKIG